MSACSTSTTTCTTSGDTITLDDSDLVRELRQLLSSHDYHSLDAFMEDETMLTRAVDDFWGVTTLLCQYITGEHYTWYEKCCQSAAKLLFYLAEHALPAEMYLALTEALDSFKEDCKLLLLLPAYAACLRRLQKKQQDWAYPEALRVAVAHLRSVPELMVEDELVNDTSSALEFTNWLLNDVDHNRFTRLTATLMHFLDTLWVHKHEEMSLANRRAVRWAYLDVLLYGLGPVYYWRCVEPGVDLPMAPNLVSKWVWHFVDSFISTCTAPATLISVLEEAATGSASSTEVEQRGLGVSHRVALYHLLMVVQCPLLINQYPQVMTAQHHLLRLMPLVDVCISSWENVQLAQRQQTTFSSASEQDQQELAAMMLEPAVLTLATLLKRVPHCARLSWRCLELDVWKRVIGEGLFKVLVNCPVKMIRISSREVLERMLEACTLEARAQLFHIWFRAVYPNSNLMAYLVSLLKEQILRCHFSTSQERAQTLTEEDEQSSQHPLGGEKLQRIMGLCVRLPPDGVESDLVEAQDWQMASLNLLKVLLLRHDLTAEHDPTGLLAHLSRLQREYLEPLRQALDISRAHYKKELTATEKKEPLSLEVYNLPRPPLSEEEQRQTLERCLTQLDLVAFTLAQVTDLIDARLGKRLVTT